MIYRALARILACLLALVALAVPAASAAERRVALVVGVSAYRHVPSLANTANDARALAAALIRLGFQVETLIDPDRARFEAAVRDFGERARGSDASLFFYAGHALELGGRNWLIPATAKLRTDRDLRFETLDLDAVLEQTDGASRVSLVFLDSCRDNPFRMQLSAVTRDVPHGGLGQVRAATGTLVAFSTAPGTVAEDGKELHSPFTAALLKWIEAPGLEVRQMLSEVRREVREATHGRQVPWENSALEGQFYFRPAAVPPRETTPSSRADLEALYWDSVRGSRDPEEYRSYLARFPDGSFAELARGRIAQLEQGRTSGSGGFRATLAARLADAVPAMAEKVRELRAQQYDQAAPHKALAVIPPDHTWRGERLVNLAAAEEAVLEGCQVFFGRPCVLLASDETLAPLTGSREQWPRRDMPRVRYAGRFDPEQIPMLTPEARLRADVAGYAGADGPKAAAIHPWVNRLFIIRSSANQRAAEEEALSACNADPTRAGADGPCFLYAAGDDVVLPKRSTQALAPNAPAPLIDATPLGRRIDEAMTPLGKTHPGTAYTQADTHKALAVQVESGRSYYWSHMPSRELAEERALEMCQLRYGTPCVLLASDDELLATEARTLPKRDMPRLSYKGPYRPEQVPFHLEQTKEVREYLAMREPKAMAIHSSLRVRIATGSSIADAESKALAACNDADPVFPCFVYARNGQVVVWQRRTEPAP